MILGKISGSATTKRFGFEAEARIRKLDYVSLKDPEGEWMLGIIDSVVTDAAKTSVSVRVIGRRDKRGFMNTPKIPFAPGTPVYSAEKDFIADVLGLKKGNAYIGLLDG